MYQFKYALVGALRRMRETGTVAVGIELLDDVSFEHGAAPVEAIQVKHSIKAPAALTDGSPQIWNTLQTWMQAREQKTLEPDARLYLVTTSLASEGTAAWYLCEATADPSKAEQRLCAVAEASTAIGGNRSAYDAFLAVPRSERLRLLSSVRVLDGAKNIVDLHSDLEAELRIARPSRVAALAEYVEGWWYSRVVRALVDHLPIQGEEIGQHVEYVVRQLADDTLPTGGVPDPPPFDEFEDALFVRQLILIDLEEAGVLQAVRDYFRAFTLRSQWQRLDLIGVGELGDYERRLTEEWQIRFRWMERDLGTQATEDEMRRQAQDLYRWVERDCTEWIRPNCIDRTVVRGSYHLLADELRIGWHAKFQERLAELLEGGVSR